MKTWLDYWREMRLHNHLKVEILPHWYIYRNIIYNGGNWKMQGVVTLLYFYNHLQQDFIILCHYHISRRFMGRNLTLWSQCSTSLWFDEWNQHHTGRMQYSYGASWAKSIIGPVKMGEIKLRFWRKSTPNYIRLNFCQPARMLSLLGSQGKN